MADEQVLTKQEEPIVADESLRELLDAGVFFGRKKAKTHPRMKPYIMGNRNGIEIINLDKTKETLAAAAEFLAERVRRGAKVLLVGTQPPAEGVLELAREFGYPVVAKRWLGGTLTNFKVIQSRIEHFKKLRSDLEKGELGKYTKKERLQIEKELERLREIMTGLESLNALPDVLLVVDPKLHLTAVREAKKLGIPVVGYVNTDCDPGMVEYPVMGNNKSRASVNWFLGKMAETVRTARQEAVQKEVSGETSEKKA